MAYTLSSITSLGTVINEESTKDSNLFFMTIPGSDSTSAFALDILGTQRTITIKGVFTSADGTISTMISQLDGLVNGTQTKRNYHSDKSGSTYGVYIQSVRWSSEEGAVSKLDYEIVMTEGA